MRALLLGTGSADGWPNPFCDCASCTWARATGAVRTTTSALIDDVLLLDCGPDAPRQAARAGRSLAGVRALLITHAHHDHLDPAALLARSWAGAAQPVQVVGPPSVIRACEQWVGPTDPVSFVAVRPGDVLEIEGYVVRVLAAAHDVGADELTRDAVLYDVTAPDASRLLWATDTGPLPDATVEAVRGAGFDLALVEETFGRRTDHGTGHLDLATFPRELARLRDSGAIDEGTDVVAVHLSHHNPIDLDRVLAPWGARTVADLTELATGDASAKPAPLPRRTLLLGGARSGKSYEAERMLAATTEVEYIATGGTRDGDAEWAARVALHRARRPSTWTTTETLDVAKVLLAPGPPVLLDCLTLWLAGVLDEAGVWAAEPGTAAREAALAVVEREVVALVDAVRRTTRTVVLVSNEVGSGVVPEHESGRLYRDLVGRLNTRVAAECEAVSLVVAGTVLPLKPLDPGSSAAAP
jgi:adenosylcobinamide kinase/adenosylcobinamide-phosphate guanylyltransferase